MEGFDSLTPRMKYSEIISLDDTLDVSVNSGKKSIFKVIKCDVGHIRLVRRTLDTENYVIDIYLKQNEDEKKKIHTTHYWYAYKHNAYADLRHIVLPVFGKGRAAKNDFQG